MTSQRQYALQFGTSPLPFSPKEFWYCEMRNCCSCHTSFHFKSCNGLMDSVMHHKQDFSRLLLAAFHVYCYRRGLLQLLPNTHWLLSLPITSGPSEVSACYNTRGWEWGSSGKTSDATRQTIKQWQEFNKLIIFSGTFIFLWFLFSGLTKKYKEILK